ncbi:type IV pilus modification protein PilV [Marinobacter sediminicola]|uniref:type IV pilus modification protein PilV n=1 Tax=Marinobacter sediminicola TaxID=3072994 RepID=UPI002810A9C6|nr:type IV pilus modification protein PilV [Marinobacter sp. F26243]
MSLQMLGMVRRPSRQAGMTLIEILVTVLVLAVGLLGMASLTVGSLKNNQGAFLRTQATILAYDMADRMKSNTAEAISGSYDGATTTASLTAPSCIASGCSGADRVAADIFAWKQQIEGANGNMAMLPGGEGAISGAGASGAGGTTAAGNVFTITITWREDRWDETQGSMSTENQQTVVEFTL